MDQDTVSKSFFNPESADVGTEDSYLEDCQQEWPAEGWEKGIYSFHRL